MKSYDIVIVGAGISGLSFAYECEKAGLNYIVLEEAQRAGGSIQTFTPSDNEKAIVELGAHTLFNTYEKCITLIEELRLDITAKKKSKLFFSPTKLSTHEESLFQRLHVGRALLCLIRLCISVFCKAKNTTNLTLKEKLVNVLGVQNYQKIAAPAFKALSNQSIENIPASVFFKRRNRHKNKRYPRRFTIKGGNENLTQTLAQKVNIVYSTKVNSIRSSGGQLICEALEHYSSKHLVLAVPGHALTHYPEILNLKSSNLSVSFDTQVAARTDENPPSMKAFDDPNYYSEIVFENAPHCVVSHSKKVNKDMNFLYQKVNTLPKLDCLGHVTARVDNVVLIGNYFSGMSIEDCIKHSHEKFKKLIRSQN